MKIMPIIKDSNRNIMNMSTRMKNACHTGYANGQKISNANNNGKIKKAYNITKGVTKEITRTTKIDDLPYIAGAIGLLTPIPLASPIMLILGKILTITVKRLHKF